MRTPSAGRLRTANRERQRVDVVLGDGRRIRGFATPRYRAVVEAFVANFETGHDVGAACAVGADRELVVDLWGGIADTRAGRPWTRRTAALMFSCTKGVLAICTYLLVERGRLELDAPIAAYWPAFAAKGKGAITLRQALSHRAGLPALDRDLSLAEVLAWDPIIRAIEDQRPLFSPEAGHFYHAMTFGWIVGEVIRRVTGQTPGRFFRLELAEPLGLRTWIGLPESEREDIAWTEPPLPDDDSEIARAAARIIETDPVVSRSFTLGQAFAFPAANGTVTFNEPAIQAAEIPGANGLSSAESLARLYAACVSGDAGQRLLTEASIQDALRVQASGPPLSGLPDDGARWGTGFQLSSPPTQPMLSPASFGHAGAGGQLAFADANHRVGFAYLTNQMGGYGDRRARQLTEALRATIGS